MATHTITIFGHLSCPLKRTLYGHFDLSSESVADKVKKTEGAKHLKQGFLPHFRANNYKKTIQILEKQPQIKNRKRDKCPFCPHVRHH